jgi:hypothetical protein
VAIFLIEELRRVGGVLVASQDGAERFEWSTNSDMPTGQRGGARAAPVKPWPIGGQLRRELTWYNGAKTPSVQVKGPEYKAQTFRGVLDDRYNFAGFALDTKRRMEAMCERGALVRVSFEQEAWEGQFSDWNFDYRRSWDIPYALTLEVHGRPADRSLAARAPATVPSPTQIFDQVDIGVQAMLDTHNDLNTGILAGDLADTSLASVSLIAGERDDLSATLDSLDTRPAARPLRQLATKLRALQAGAFDIVNELGAVKADTDLISYTAMNVLDFEGWSRSMRFQARAIMGMAGTGARSLEERDEPRADRIYEPRANEDLRAISQFFYGTPHAWRLIADRNRLRGFTLTGEEKLIIPTRGHG